MIHLSKKIIFIYSYIAIIIFLFIHIQLHAQLTSKETPKKTYNANSCHDNNPLDPDYVYRPECYTSKTLPLYKNNNILKNTRKNHTNPDNNSVYVRQILNQKLPPNTTHLQKNFNKSNSSLPKKLNYLNWLIRIGKGKEIKDWIKNKNNSQSLRPKWKKYLSILIAYYVDNDKHALKNLRKFMLANRSFWQARLSLAEIYYQKKNFSAAKNHYQLLLLSPTIRSIDRSLIKTRLRRLQALIRYETSYSVSIITPFKSDFNNQEAYLSYLPYKDSNLSRLNSGYGINNKFTVRYSPIITDSLDLTFSFKIDANNFLKSNYNKYYGETKANVRFKNSYFNDVNLFSFYGQKYLSSTHISNLQGLGLNINRYFLNKYILSLGLKHSNEKNLYNPLFNEINNYFTSSFSFIPEGRQRLLGQKNTFAFEIDSRKTDYAKRSRRNYTFGFNSYNELSANYNIFYGGAFRLTKNLLPNYKTKNLNKYLLKQQVYELKLNTALQFLEVHFFDLTPIIGLDLSIKQSNISSYLNTSLNINLRFTRKY